MAANTKTHTEVAHTPGAHEKALPPFFNQQTFSSQLVWLAICFVILYWFLSRVALPRVGTIIEQRRQRIARDLDEATRLKEETEKAIASYEQALAEAKAKAHSIAQETRDALQAEVSKEQEQVEQEIAAKLEEAENRIADAKAEALSHVQEVASETTKALMNKLLGVKVPDQELDAAVKASLGSN
ncbi:MAG: F0F1 ATP synthase subunit B [Methyloligellaceae bacterium]